MMHFRCRYVFFWKLGVNQFVFSLVKLVRMVPNTAPIYTTNL